MLVENLYLNDIYLKKSLASLQFPIPLYKFLTNPACIDSSSNIMKPKENFCFIYELIDPLTNKPRYIGKTSYSLYHRLQGHLLDKGNNHKINWFKSLKKQNLIPKIQLIDEVEEKDWKFWEIYYISLYKSWGFNLINGSIGGEGSGRGWHHSEESKQKMSKPKHSEESKRRIGNALKNIKFSKEHCQKMSDNILILKEKDIIEIMNLLNEYKLNIIEIAKIFKIDGSVISSIKNNDSTYNKKYNLYFKDDPNHKHGYLYSKQQIEEIIKLLQENKLTQKEIGKITGINLCVISNIKLNKSYYNKIYNLYL